MRILFVIPHYYGNGAAGYGSTDLNKSNQRVLAVKNCISSLHQHFGANQFILPWSGQEPIPANRSTNHEIQVVVCVTGEDHLLNQLDIPQNLYVRYVVQLDNPLKLGFACYDVLRHCYGNYDWYCYLEDDLIINDPLFFHKLAMFYSSLGHDAYLLQPHRFEIISSSSQIQKAYIDGPLWEHNLMEIFANVRPVAGVTELCLNAFGVDWRMLLATNPHSGCFFLMESQLGRMLNQSWCGNYDESFCGPMESAATLYIMAFFNIYKPAPECTSFLELHHFHQRYI